MIFAASSDFPEPPVPVKIVTIFSPLIKNNGSQYKTGSHSFYPHAFVYAGCLYLLMICLKIFLENAITTYMAKMPRPIGSTVVNTVVQLVTRVVKDVLIAVVTAVAVSVLIFFTPFLKSDYGRKSRITVYIPRII
jgi:hypothetical protein